MVAANKKEIDLASLLRYETDMATVFLGLGANLGDRKAQILGAQLLLASNADYKLVACSPFYESPALLKEGSPPEWNLPFLNAVSRWEVSANPLEMLAMLKAIERNMGRDENAPLWSPRVIDMDLLAYENVVMDSPALILPHPQIAERDFVLLPWREIAPDWKSPDVSALCSQLTRVQAKIYEA